MATSCNNLDRRRRTIIHGCGCMHSYVVRRRTKGTRQHEAPLPSWTARLDLRGARTAVSSLRDTLKGGARSPHCMC